MNLHRPPKLAEKILERLLYDDVWKTMLGDLQEFYHVLYEEEGKSKADRWYWRQIIKYAPSKILHKFIWSIEMFLNYLKISFRNLKKHKSYSFINIFGLAVGLISFILIAIYLFYEISYDNYHPQSDQTYMITYNFPENEYMGSTRLPLLLLEWLLH
jgi:putative ABC transport system permease protein